MTEASETTAMIAGNEVGTESAASDRRRADRFIQALRALESRRDVEPLTALHSDTADIGNVVSPRTFTGQDGAREFWTIYRQTLGEITSEFRTVIVAGDRAALEWTTTGTAPNGHPIRYDGVSVIEFTDDHISRFRAYFDPAALGHQITDR